MYHWCIQLTEHKTGFLPPPHLSRSVNVSTVSSYVFNSEKWSNLKERYSFELWEMGLHIKQHNAVIISSNTVFTKDVHSVS